MADDVCDQNDGGDAWPTAQTPRRSGCSAARASTRSSTTCARSRSTRPTDRRRIRVFLRRGRWPAGRLPAPPRAAPHAPAAPDQLPRQRLGHARAGRQGRHRAVRRRLAPARRQARRLRRVRPVRRSHDAAGPTPSTTARSSPTSRRPMIYDPVLREPRRRHHPRPWHRGPRRRHRRRHPGPAASPRSPSRNGSATRAGRSST